MPTAAGWTTLEKIRALVQPNAGITTDDAALIQLGADVTAAMISSLGRAILTASYTDYLDGKGTDTVMTKRYPITAVASVLMDDAAVSIAGNSQAWGYQFDDHALIMMNDVWTKGRRNVKVTYTAGYAAVPADLIQACTRQAAYIYRAQPREGVRSAVLPQGENVTYVVDEWLPAVETVLERYRFRGLF